MIGLSNAGPTVSTDIVHFKIKMPVHTSLGRYWQDVKSLITKVQSMRNYKKLKNWSENCYYLMPYEDMYFLVS